MIAAPLILYVGLVNSADLEARSVYDVIESTGDGFETYELDRTQISKAAFDYLLLIEAAGSLASVAQLLWLAYDTLRRARSPGSSEPELYVVVRDAAGGVAVEYRIGATHTDEEMFIGDFVRACSRVRTSEGGSAAFEQESSQIRSSGVWIRRK